MPTYRPISDTWFLTRARLVGGIKYYGAYPGGFLHRARALLGVQPDDAVLHVCGGMVRHYPYSGVGPNDRTLDLDPATAPDIVGDARNPYPQGFRAILADPPYSKPDAARYVPGAGVYGEVVGRMAPPAAPAVGRAAPRPPARAPAAAAPSAGRRRIRVRSARGLRTKWLLRVGLDPITGAMLAQHEVRIPFGNMSADQSGGTQMKCVPSVAAVSGLALCLAGTAGAVTEDQFKLHNTGDLAALCSAAATDPLYTAAVNFCQGFGAGTYGVLAEVQQADPKFRLFCPPEGITRNEAIGAFVSWAGANPSNAAMPATDGVTAFLRQTYPCPASATPERRRTR